ncbi:hypothetical protein J2Y73_003503 [Peribacillus frigoritolerans]|nr:hypothetical protein [Peribacillus frigoritolerans]
MSTHSVALYHISETIVSLIFCATMENMIYDSLAASTILPVHLQENRLYPLLDLFLKKVIILHIYTGTFVLIMLFL